MRAKVGLARILERIFSSLRWMFRSRGVKHISNKSEILAHCGLTVLMWTTVCIPTARRHWAYRDARPSTDVSVRSPFGRHSAEVIEYWSFDAELRDRWLEVLMAASSGPPSRLESLGFPLDRRVERVGNLMIAGAEDAITCDLTARHDQKLRMTVDGNDLPTARLSRQRLGQP